MPPLPESSVSKFAAPGTGGDDSSPEAEETAEGENYSDPDSAGEPAIMLSQAQADAAGMSDAMPGDTFTVKLTIAEQNDDGVNVSIMPGSAMKEQGPDMAPPAPPMGASMKPSSPTDLGMSPTIGNT